MRSMWRFGWWRWAVVLAARYAPSGVSGWLFYHSGLGESLEELYRREEDWAMVRRCRMELMRLAAIYESKEWRF